MKIKIVIITVAFVLMPILALANFAVQLENTFDRKLYYYIYWIDHPYGWRAPANMAGGELNAAEKTRIDGSFQQGKYRIVWKDKGQWRNEMLMVIKKDVTLITVRPEKAKY